MDTTSRKHHYNTSDVYRRRARFMDRMGRQLILTLNPIRFAEQFFPHLDNWQRNVLLSIHPHLLLTTGRQVGKSSCVAILALHHALNEPHALVLVVSPSLRQSGELFKKIAQMHATVRSLPAQAETALTLQLHNGSRIVSLPSKEQTIRGYSGVSLLLIDEAALVPDDLYHAVRPMLAVSNGRLIALSTPHGQRGWFFNEWKNGEGWERYEIKATECPRISKAFLEAERQSLGTRIFEQEYLCKFHESEGALFSFDVIKRAIKDFPEIELPLDVEEENTHEIISDDGFELDLN